ncbi:MAG: TVP38/TMEM64 family protein [Aerococcus sp.]|nr:TVP38/TMEM64 family protein [Aerococcus sp.]
MAQDELTKRPSLADTVRKSHLSVKQTRHSKLINKVLTVISVFGLLLTIWIIIHAWRMGLFTDQAKLANYLHSTGVWAPLIFIVIQIVQTVIQIIPGALTCPAGAMIFGMWYGFLLNFIGIMIGSVINFFLARRFGRPLVLAFVGEKLYNRYVGALNTQGFKRIFAFGMFFPVSPADALTLLAGLSNLDFKTFFTLLALGKPFTLFTYTYGLTVVINWIVQWLS